MPATAPDRSRPRARDGTAEAGKALSRSPEPIHTVPRLHACSPNRSDKNGMPRAARERGRICKGVAPRLGAIAAEKKTFHLPPQLRHGRIERFRPRIDDDGPLRIQPIERVAYGFTQPPFDPVARHSLAQRTGDRKSNPRSFRVWIANAKGGKARPRKPAALVINPSEVLRSQQADAFRKTSDGLVPFGADRELLAPTRSAPREHRPAILRLHSGAETVRLGALAVVWLIRTLRHSSSTI